MSITFSPVGNVVYCEENNLTSEISYPCQCVDFNCTQGCRECNSQGKVSFTEYPFEMNVSSDNAIALLGMLGIKGAYAGKASAEKFLEGIAFIRALNASGHEPLVTTNKSSKGRNGAHMIECGRTTEQVQGYLDSLEKIAMEAARRKVKVIWS